MGELWYDVMRCVFRCVMLGVVFTDNDSNHVDRGRVKRDVIAES